MTNVTQMNETDRQYYFMEKASGHVAKLGEELGRRPTCCVTTFGCQMNARDSEKLVGILEKVGYEIIEDDMYFLHRILIAVIDILSFVTRKILPVTALFFIVILMSILICTYSYTLKNRFFNQLLR